MNSNTLTAAILGLLVGGAIAEVLTDVFALISGGATLAGAAGLAYGYLAQRRRRGRNPIDWGPDPGPNPQAAAAFGAAIGACAGLILGVLDALIGG
jgi:hypothetical protein